MNTQTLKVLSIDFDYFQHTNKDTVQTCYPDGIDLNTELSSLVWSGYYANPKTEDQLKNVALLTDEFALLQQILSSDTNIKMTAPVLITNSHVHIYDFIHRCARQFHADKINLVNIDMHHDILNNNDELDCGNWISFIAKDFKDKCDISWICNPTSLECYGLKEEGILPVDTTLKAIQDCKFDIVFLCRSDNWLPPHLDAYFHQIVMLLQKRFRFVSISDDVKHPRDMEPLIQMQKQCIHHILTQTT